MRSAGDILGRYTLLKRLAGGGMGEVFLATSASAVGPGARIALKVLRAELANDARFVQMIIDEAWISMFLNHQNIVSVLDFAEQDGNYYLAMEFVQGTTVERLIELLRSRSKKLELGIALFIAAELGRALRYAHGCVNHLGEPLHIVHRDVTPANVLLSIYGEVKLTDFGIARAKGRIHQTQAGVMKGKFGYLAPEVARYESIDARADLFSLGVLLYHLVTGHHPVSGASAMEAIFRFEEKRFPPPSALNPEISPALEAVIKKALEPQPSDRWSSAEAMGSALQDVVSSSSELRRSMKGAPQALTALMRDLCPEVFDDPLPSPRAGVDEPPARVDSQEFAALETRVNRPDGRVPIVAPLTSSPEAGPVVGLATTGARPPARLVPIDTSDLLLTHDAVTLQGSEFGDTTAIDMPVSEVRRAVLERLSGADRPPESLKTPVLQDVPGGSPATFLEATTIGDAMRLEEPTAARQGAQRIDFVQPSPTDLGEKAKTDLMLERPLPDPELAPAARRPNKPGLEARPWLGTSTGGETTPASQQAAISVFGDRTAVDVQRQLLPEPRASSELGLPTDINMPALADPFGARAPVSDSAISNMPVHEPAWETETVTDQSLLAMEPMSQPPVEGHPADDFGFEPTQVRSSRIEDEVGSSDQPPSKGDDADDPLSPGWRTEKWMAGAMDPSELPRNDDAAANRAITTRNAGAPAAPKPLFPVMPVRGRIMRGTTPVGPLDAPPGAISAPSPTSSSPAPLVYQNAGLGGAPRSSAPAPPQAPIPAPAAPLLPAPVTASAPTPRLFAPQFEPPPQLDTAPRSRLMLGAFLAIAVAVGTAAGVLTYPRLIRPTLKLITEPPGASVKINGRPLGVRTPLAIEVAPHESKRIELEVEGYVPEARDVRPLDPGQTYALSVVLRRNVPELRITPVAGSVFIDDRAIGSGEVVRLTDVEPSSPVELRVEAPGHEAYRRRFSRGSEVPALLEIKLEPAKAGPEGSAQPGLVTPESDRASGAGASGAGASGAGASGAGASGAGASGKP